MFAQTWFSFFVAMDAVFLTILCQHVDVTWRLDLSAESFSLLGCSLTWGTKISNVVPMTLLVYLFSRTALPDHSVLFPPRSLAKQLRHLRIFMYP